MESFRNVYLKEGQTFWRDAHQLFNSPMKSGESVDMYVARVKKGARKLDISDSLLHAAILGGLRSTLRIQVLQHGAKTLEETVRLAKLSEMNTGTGTDTLPSFLVDSINSTNELMKRQAADIQKLSEQVKSMSEQPTISSIQDSKRSSRVEVERSTEEGQRQRFQAPEYGRRSPSPRWSRPESRNPESTPERYRQLKNTPRNQQRLNYAREAEQQSRRFQESKRSDSNCRNCGWNHAFDQCPARNQVCRNCNRLGHWARCCRSARPQ